MSFPVLLFLALLGTTFLGFLSSWFLQNEKLRAVKEENSKLSNQLSELQQRYSELTKQAELNALTVENLQQLLLDYEQKVFDYQRKLQAPKQNSSHAQFYVSLPKVVGGEIDPIESDEAPSQTNGWVRTDPFSNDNQECNDLITAFKRGIELERAGRDH